MIDYPDISAELVDTVPLGYYLCPECSEYFMYKPNGVRESDKCEVCTKGYDFSHIDKRLRKFTGHEVEYAGTLFSLPESVNLFVSSWGKPKQFVVLDSSIVLTIKKLGFEKAYGLAVNLSRMAEQRGLLHAETVYESLFKI